jgi:hypothetical protein
MDEMQQLQDEYEQRLTEALDKVEQGYITQDRMDIIRHACNVPRLSTSKTIPPLTVYNFTEIFGDKK